MNKKEKFENFLESLKGNGQDTLIESVKKGFQVCHEGKIPEESTYFQEVDRYIDLLSGSVMDTDLHGGEIGIDNHGNIIQYGKIIDKIDSLEKGEYLLDQFKKQYGSVPKKN